MPVYDYFLTLACFRIDNMNLKSFGKSWQSCKDCKDKSCAVAVLKDHELDLLNGNCQESDVQKGEIIIRAGALNSHIIYLRSGYAKEYLVDASQKTQIIQIIKKHSYLGLQSLFGDKINHYSYAALEDLKICYIDINVFKGLIRENGNFAHELLVYICKESLYNFSRFIQQNQKKINGRFADIMLYLSEKIYNSNEFMLHLNRQELADLIGVSRENTARVLSKFKADKIIEVEGEKIKILKADLLQKISRNG